MMIAVLADVAWVVVAVVFKEMVVVLGDKMVVVVDVPPVVDDIADGVRDDVLPLWLLSVVADAAMVGVWLMFEAVIPEVIEAETWFVAVLMVAVLPEELVAVAPADIEAAADIVVAVWPDTNTEGKRIPNKRRSRAAVWPVLRERRTNFASYFMVQHHFNYSY